MITDIYTDMRVLLGWAWTYLIVAELIGVSSGITYFINQQAKYRDYDKVFASIMLIGLIGLGTDLFLASLGGSSFPWQKSARSGWLEPILQLFRRKGDVAPRHATEPVAERPSARVSEVGRAHDPGLELPELPRAAARGGGALPSLCASDRSCSRSRTWSRRFETSGPPVTALDRVSFEAHRREFFCVIGPSGCGKSTLARILAGLDDYTSGDVLLDGAPDPGPGPSAAWCFRATRSSRGSRF